MSTIRALEHIERSEICEDERFVRGNTWVGAYEQSENGVDTDPATQEWREAFNQSENDV
jgi:hypothetical protein